MLIRHKAMLAIIVICSLMIITLTSISVFAIEYARQIYLQNNISLKTSEFIIFAVFLVLIATSGLFGLYALLRKWQLISFHSLQQDILAAIDQPSDKPVVIQTNDPDIQPLVQTLNDLFWVKDQRSQHLLIAHQKADMARIRATRLANETRAINEALANEISIRQDVENQLQDTKNLLDGILNAMPTALFALDSRNHIVQCNRQAGEWLNRDHTQLKGLPLLELIPELTKVALLPKTPAHPALLQKAERLAISSFTQSMITHVLVYPLSEQQQARIVVRIDDVSHRHKMEEIMVQTEKMMTVGGLAAGMAHEINNPLGAILQNLQNIRRRTQQSLDANVEVADSIGIELDDVQKYLEQRAVFTFYDHIQEAGERAAGIIKNMLQFARNDQQNKRIIAVGELMDSTLAIASNDFSLTDITVLASDDLRQQTLECVPSEIQQVLVNLLRNAQQALDAFESAEVDWHPAIIFKAVAQKSGISFVIEDNGPGIEHNHIKHIFEPFFTTKEVSQGTGLGLSVSYFIITSHHNGKLTYAPNSRGHGARFDVFLPFTSAAPEHPITPVE
ncbi:MAG: ATP-binding protein [Oleibacter sp.]|nr:ATP-binding protein [Thalassolituus sp.]